MAKKRFFVLLFFLYFLLRHEKNEERHIKFRFVKCFYSLTLELTLLITSASNKSFGNLIVMSRRMYPKLIVRL